MNQNNNYRNNAQRSNFVNRKEENEYPLKDVERILDCESKDYDFFIKEAENWANIERQKETPNQIRNFYDDLILTIKEDETAKSDIGRLKIMLAYAKGRKNIKTTFFENMNALSEGLMKNPSKNRIKNFKNFLEAYVAYTKLYSKDKQY